MDLKLYSFDYKYWTISLMEKQELEQPNFEPLKNTLNDLINYYACLLHLIFVLFFSFFLFGWLILTNEGYQYYAYDIF